MSASNSPDFAFVIESSLPVRSAVVAIWKAATAASWTVVGDYDLTGLMATAGGAGFEMKSIDICQPDLALPFLKHEMLSSLVMPCNVIIYRMGDRTRIASLRPSVILSRLFAGISDDLGDLPERIDRELREILEAAR
ncbi:DUF302 domain-containing protein [Candidatus Acetothermia bacterium]|nr:DUF302 domain-containing protein [Candidatus Acetothermia bacterium]MBI3643467.1 DUF302 domain-containing protein [Candidatus Acetothermia bacterium]